MIVNQTAKYVPAGTSERKLLANAGGGTLYYSISSAVSSSEKEGELTSGQVKEAVKGYWVVSASQTNLSIEYARDPAGEDFATVAELTTEKSARETKDAERIVGPASATSTDLTIFEGTTGKKAKDSGITIAAVEGKITGPSEAVDTDLAIFDGVTGKKVKDSGITKAAVEAKATKTEVTTEKERAETAEALKVAKASSLAATTTDVLTSKITTDTEQRYIVNADGKQEWGKGESTAPDVSLERSTAATLQVVGHLYATASISSYRGGTSSISLTDQGIFAFGSASAQSLEIDSKGAGALYLNRANGATGGTGIEAESGKIGFFGKAPAVRPEVKKAALTADELAVKLASLGLIKIEA